MRCSLKAYEKKYIMLSLDSREDKDLWEIVHSLLLIAKSFQVL